MDGGTTPGELKEIVEAFISERNWAHYFSAVYTQLNTGV